MKAWTLRAYGAPDVVRLEDATDPAPGADEVVVRIEAASLNPLDNKIVSGAVKDYFPVKFPFVLGNDFAGTVDQVGANVTALKPGNRVAANAMGGALGERVKLPAASAVSLPEGVSFAQAAALATAGGTAWEALMDKAQLKSGQTVLIHAASGGVGHVAVQLAKLAGAHVIATCSDENRHLVTDLGADDVIDYKTTDFRTEASDVDVVLDTQGGETLARSLEVLREGGIVVSLVAQPDEAEAAKRQVRAVQMSASLKPETLAHLLELVASGKLRVVIDETYPFDQALAALAQVANGHVAGKVVVNGR